MAFDELKLIVKFVGDDHPRRPRRGNKTHEMSGSRSWKPWPLQSSVTSVEGDVGVLLSYLEAWGWEGCLPTAVADVIFSTGLAGPHFSSIAMFWCIYTCMHASCMVLKARGTRTRTGLCMSMHVLVSASCRPLAGWFFQPFETSGFYRNNMEIYRFKRGREVLRGR